MTIYKELSILVLPRHFRVYYKENIGRKLAHTFRLILGLDTYIVTLPLII